MKLNRSESDKRVVMVQWLGLLFVTVIPGFTIKVQIQFIFSQQANHFTSKAETIS